MLREPCRRVWRRTAAAATGGCAGRGTGGGRRRRRQLLRTAAGEGEVLPPPRRRHRVVERARAGGGAHPVDVRDHVLDLQGAHRGGQPSGQHGEHLWHAVRLREILEVEAE